MNKALPVPCVLNLRTFLRLNIVSSTVMSRRLPPSLSVKPFPGNRCAMQLFISTQVSKLVLPNCFNKAGARLQRRILPLPGKPMCLRLKAFTFPLSFYESYSCLPLPPQRLSLLHGQPYI